MNASKSGIRLTDGGWIHHWLLQGKGQAGMMEINRLKNHLKSNVPKPGVCCHGPMEYAR